MEKSQKNCQCGRNNEKSGKWKNHPNIENLEESIEKRYIEYSNPSQDVIKKFLRDVEKWNFTKEVEMSSEDFPSPTYEIIDETLMKY